MFDHLQLNENDVERKNQIREVLIDKYFSKMSWWSDKNKGKYTDEMERHVDKRYNQSIEYFLPWISNVYSLENADVLEIGCGTGSSTVAIAQLAKKVTAYDIHLQAVEAAEERAKVYGLENITFCQAKPEDILSKIEESHPKNSIDVAILYAVLEHQTVEERLKTLRMCWEMLRPGGVIVVAETPNRLTYFDEHTSRLPFYHLLPLEIQKQYFDRSPRTHFVENVKTHFDKDYIDTHMLRWGQSVSYHEFEITLGSVKDHLVSDGYEPSILKRWPLRKEEVLLYSYFKNLKLDIPMGFCRPYLDLIFQKPLENGKQPTVPKQDRHIPGLIDLYDTHAKAYATIQERDKLAEMLKQLKSSKPIRIAESLRRKPLLFWLAKKAYGFARFFKKLFS